MNGSFLLHKEKSKNETIAQQIMRIAAITFGYNKKRKTNVI